MLFEVSKESGVREVLETRGIVSHDVDRSWEIERLVAITAMALVGAGVVAEEGGGPIGGNGSLADT